MQYHPEGYYTSELLDHLGVFHVFGAKGFGSAFLKNVVLPKTKQVHGTDIIFFDEVDPDRTYVGDAYLTDRPRIACIARTADCLPILLCDPGKKVAGAIHAGWRGLSAHIIKKTVTAFLERGSGSGDIHVAIGPHIHSCCFEVGDDLKKNFSREGWDLENFYVKREEKDCFDLKKVAFAELKEAGIGERQIDSTELCTSCHQELFYSYRRDRIFNGHQLSLIHWTL